MALWHDLYEEETVPEDLGEMSKEAWTLRKRGVDILRCYQKGDFTYLVVKTKLDYSLTCAAVQHYLMARFETKYRKVGIGDFYLKGALEFVFVPND